uniref:Uncharacterized protein n=1 Tax=Clytia hemisphaerica TaxID=252671 RepID=A0A7M5XGQ4_9CNID
MEQDRRNNNTNDTNEKTYKYHSQGCIYNNRQITVLKQHEDKNTIPLWLMPTTKSTVKLNEEDQEKHNTILTAAGRQLRNVLMTHHKRELDQHTIKRNELKRKIRGRRLSEIDEDIGKANEAKATIIFQKTCK